MKRFVIIVIFFLAGCATMPKYSPIYENEGIIRGDTIIINKNGIEVMLRHFPGERMKFEIIIANNRSRHAIFFAPRNVVLLDENKIQYEALTPEEALKYEFPYHREDSFPVKVKVTDVNEYERLKDKPTGYLTEDEKKTLLLEGTIDNFKEEQERKEREKQRKQLYDELESEIIRPGDIVTEARKQGILYFKPIRTKHITILCEIEKELFRFKFSKIE